MTQQERDDLRHLRYQQEQYDRTKRRSQVGMFGASIFAAANVMQLAFMRDDPTASRARNILTVLALTGFAVYALHADSILGPIKAAPSEYEIHRLESRIAAFDRLLTEK